MTSSEDNCRWCGTRLARDTKGELCAACLAKTRDMRFSPPTVPAAFWEAPVMREALVARHMGKILRAFRKHPHHLPHKFSQEIAGAWLNIDQSQISRIEKGPPPNDLDWLSRTARVLAIPDHLLWFSPQLDAASDDGDVADGAHDAQEHPGHLSGVTPTHMRNTSDQEWSNIATGIVRDDPDIAGDWDEMERRRLLQLAALMGTGALTVPDEKLRRLADTVLTSEPRTLEEWELVCADHLHAIRTRSPLKAREDMLIDLLTVRRQIQAPGDKDVGELQRVQSALATLYANALTRLGEHGPAIRWWRTARQAADICGDPNLQLLVRGSEAGFGLYGQRPPEIVLRLTRSARQIGGSTSSGGRAQVISAEAKALSAMGRHNEAKQRIQELEEFTLGAWEANPIPNYWTSDQVNFAKTWVYAAIGDELNVDKAGALVLAHSGDYQYAANVRLHSAVCTVVNGGIDQGMGQASALLDSLPNSHRSQMITETGNTVLQAVPIDQRNRPSVHEFREVLATTAPNAHALSSGA